MCLAGMTSVYTLTLAVSTRAHRSLAPPIDIAGGNYLVGHSNSFMPDNAGQHT